DFEERPTAARLLDARRHHDAAAEVSVTRVVGDDVHVAHDVFPVPRLDAVDEVVSIDVRADRVALAGRRFDGRAPGEDCVALAVDGAARRSRIVRGGAFQETPRRDVELERLAPRYRSVGR